MGVYRAPMDRGSKGKPTQARFAIAQNVRYLMEHHREGYAVGLSSRQLEARCGVSYKTIDRLTDPYNDINPNLDTLDAIALFFGIETWQLLKPNPLLQSSTKPPSPVTPKRRTKV